ncbi:MAG: CRISPR-associated endonuclease Cas2 [Bacteroides sp.]|nr:CRISPR-associated endonuclease Cas2 [Bacillota bacterium]MCM1455546.1 CRISPR-associated endonuclease Cas2 [Bacteroides sp.]
MRTILFFDLPTETSSEVREYTKFHKFLIKNGFAMMQKSVYCHLSLNATAVGSTIAAIRKNKPVKGLVQVLTVTEKQFARMEFIVGQYDGDILNSDSRLVVL